MMVMLPGDRLKRIWVDRNAYADGRPAWVVQEATGLFIQHRARAFTVQGEVVSRGGRKDEKPLYEHGPALWEETMAPMVLEL